MDILLQDVELQYCLYFSKTVYVAAPSIKTHIISRWSGTIYNRLDITNFLSYLMYDKIQLL